MDIGKSSFRSELVDHNTVNVSNIFPVVQMLLLVPAQSVISDMCVIKTAMFVTQCESGLFR